MAQAEGRVVAQLRVAEIVVDPGLQARAETREDWAQHLAELLRQGNPLLGPWGVDYPAVFRSAEGDYLVRGFHRHRARVIVRQPFMDCEIMQGTYREAQLFAVGDNSDHGWRRSHEDIARAVRILLVDPEWRKWPNVRIAEACRVDEGTVRRHRKALYAEEQERRRRLRMSARADIPETRTRSNGRPYTVAPRPARPDPAKAQARARALLCGEQMRQALVRIGADAAALVVALDLLLGDVRTLPG